MPNCEGKSGRRQPGPDSPEPTRSLPGASLQLTCASQQRSQMLHGAPSWPLSQQLWISRSHRCGCAVKALTWNLCYWSKLSETHTWALTTVTKGENGAWQYPLKCKISWWHTPDDMVGELLPRSGTGGCKEEVGCRGMGPRIPALHVRGLWKEGMHLNCSWFRPGYSSGAMSPSHPPEWHWVPVTSKETHPLSGPRQG